MCLHILISFLHPVLTGCFLYFHCWMCRRNTRHARDTLFEVQHLWNVKGLHQWFTNDWWNTLALLKAIKARNNYWCDKVDVVTFFKKTALHIYPGLTHKNCLLGIKWRKVLLRMWLLEVCSCFVKKEKTKKTGQHSALCFNKKLKKFFSSIKN